MNCGFCGRKLPGKIEQKPCGACPGGCRKIHCPWCGYANPAPPKLWRKRPGGDDKKQED